MRSLYSFLYFIIMIPSNAQEMKTTIAGVYFLTSVRESASVFDLKADSSFEFFFSQGALGRGGAGKWSVKNGQVVLNSVWVRPPKDYTLVTSKTIPGHETIIKMVDKNTMILSYSDVTLKTPAGVFTGQTDSHGEVRFNQNHGSELALLFRLCPDRQSTFGIGPTHNYFEFKLEPWIADVFFKDLVLRWQPAQLSGLHPLLEGKDFRYIQEK